MLLVLAVNISLKVVLKQIMKITVCLSVSKWYLVKVKLNSSQTQISLFQGVNSNFPTSIPDLFTWANFTDLPCNFSILCSSHISFFSCLFECSGSLGVIFLHFQVKMNLKIRSCWNSKDYFLTCTEANLLKGPITKYETVK